MYKRNTSPRIITPLITLALTLSTIPGYAALQPADIYAKLKQGQGTIQLGLYSANQGTSQHVGINGLIGDDYSVTSGTRQNGLVGLAFFIPSGDYERFTMSYGLNAFYFVENSVSGTITQENLFTNLGYHYDISNLPIYIAAKALIKTNDTRYNIMLDAGIGPNFITTSSFKQTPLNSSSIIDNNAFKGTTNTEFSAMAGVGVRLNTFGKTPLECGYRIFYLGQGQLNSGNSQILSNLDTGNNYAQAIVCGISFS